MTEFILFFPNSFMTEYTDFENIESFICTAEMRSIRDIGSAAFQATIADYTDFTGWEEMAARASLHVLQYSD